VLPSDDAVLPVRRYAVAGSVAALFNYMELR